MKVVNLIRNIGPIKCMLLILFIILPLFEFVDTTFDIGDVSAILLLLLLLNDIFLPRLPVLYTPSVLFFDQRSVDFNKFDFEFAKKITFIGKVLLSRSLLVDHNAVGFSHYLNLSHGTNTTSIKVSDPSWHSAPMEEHLLLKRSMNIIFLIITLGPIILDFFNVSTLGQQRLFFIGLMAWSLILLAMSVVSCVRNFKITGLIYCLISIMVLVVSILMV